jgi:peptide/nickel transport system permease protein
MSSAASEALPDAHNVSRWRKEPYWRRFLRRPLGVAGLAWLLLVVTGAIFAPLIAPYNPATENLTAVLSGPSAKHLLGTDPLGRDVLSWLLYGAGPTLLGVAAALGSCVLIGVTLGVLGGYARGRIDSAVSRVSDLLLSLPALVVLLVVFSVFPNTLLGPMAVLGLVFSGNMTRVVRSATLTVREELYIRAARVAGLSHTRIVIRHVLPRIASTVIVQSALFAGIALIIENGLAYLGFGIVPPAPSWGGLISEAAQVVSRSPWLLIPSGGTLGLTVLAFVLVGNAVRDVTTESWAGLRRSPTRPRRTARAQSFDTADASTSKPVLDPDTLLSVERLSVAFPGGAGLVLTDASFTVKRGETVAVLGESGCGKTITALAVLGLLPAGAEVISGRVMFDGKNLLAAGARQLAEVRGSRIGYVAQDPMVSLDPTFTVGAQIAEAVRTHTGCSRSASYERARQLLALVRIPDPAGNARRYPHQLSGGMLQRCVIALALAGEPDLLIADEPTTALDVTIQAEILALIDELRRERGLAVLLITHDWGVVASIADRTIVMYAGEVVELSAASSLFEDPEHPYTRGLMASNPQRAQIGERLPAIRGAVPAPGSWPTGCRFAPRCPEAEDICWGGPIAIREISDGHLARCIHAGLGATRTPAAAIEPTTVADR